MDNVSESAYIVYAGLFFLTNTTIAEFANTVDPDETAHHEPSHLNLQSLPSIVFDF